MVDPTLRTWLLLGLGFMLGVGVASFFWELRLNRVRSDWRDLVRVLHRRIADLKTE